METIQILSKDIQYILNNLNEMLCENVTMSELKSKIRTNKLAIFRAIIVYVINKATPKKYRVTTLELGKALNKHHATVLHYMKLVENLKIYSYYRATDIEKAFVPNELLDVLIEDYKTYKNFDEMDKEAMLQNVWKELKIINRKLIKYDLKAVIIDVADEPTVAGSFPIN
ncbi:MAG TPA: helix-turn-helix domain-containing protein [Defluviitoga tunisiensis]|nr:helix-turn-helix domain-containing protein [Defluviitoga tunisiensis]